MHLFKHLWNDIFLSHTSNYWQCQSMKKTGIFPPMKWDNFQSAITCAYTSSLLKHSIQVKSGQIIPFRLLQLLCCCQKSSRHLLWILSSVYLSWLLHRSGSTRGSWVQSVANMLPWCYKNGAPPAESQRWGQCQLSEQPSLGNDIFSSNTWIYKINHVFLSKETVNKLNLIGLKLQCGLVKLWRWNQENWGFFPPLDNVCMPILSSLLAAHRPGYLKEARVLFPKDFPVQGLPCESNG